MTEDTVQCTPDGSFAGIELLTLTNIQAATKELSFDAVLMLKNREEENEKINANFVYIVDG